jgi:hypothetical protein
MVEEDKLFETKLKDKGIFDFKETYRITYEWLINEGYLVNEKTYKETAKGPTKDVEIEWVAYKAISDYFRLVIKIRWLILGMSDVEVEIDGQKQKMNKGQMEIKFSSILQKDYESRWEHNAFMKFMRTMYDRYLIPSRIEQYEGKLLGEMDELIAELKAFLALTGKR